MNNEGSKERAMQVPAKLTEATIKDSAFLLGVRNDPVTVQHSMSGRAVTQAEHDAWLPRMLAAPRVRLYIVEIEGLWVSIPAGYIRLDDLLGVTEVNIAIAARCRGLGLAQQALRMAVEANPFGSRSFYARVLTKNSASLVAFLKTGWTITGFYPDAERAHVTLGLRP